MTMHPQLYFARRDYGLTQKEVADMLGIHSSTYYKKESGIVDLTLTEAIKLSTHFNKSLDSLFMKGEVTQ